MSERSSQLTLREAHKRMLLAESELNRLQFAQEWCDFKDELQDLTRSLRTIGEFAESAAKAGAVFSAWRQFWARPDGETQKRSWLPSLFRGVKLGTALWLAVRIVRRGISRKGL